MMERSTGFDYNSLDRRGAVDYETGNERFDEKIADYWLDLRPKEMEKQFIKKYGEEVVTEDLKEIERIKHSPWYDQERSPVATMAELSITEGIGRREWLGEDAAARLTSEYDDVKNGADVLITIPDPNDPEGDDIVFVVDITTTNNETVLERKIYSELARLQEGKRTRLKYFRGVAEVNRFILGFPADEVGQIGRHLTGELEDELVRDTARLELIDELNGQALQQTVFVLEHHCGLDVSGVESFGDLFELMNNNRQLINDTLKDKLEMLAHIDTNVSLIQYLMAVAAEVKNKKGTGGVNHSPWMVNFLISVKSKEIVAKYGRRRRVA